MTMSFRKYQIAKDEAQKKADETGFDYGLEFNSVFHTYRVFMLPQKKNRCGYELHCEVVMCSTLNNCKPGHGP
jgi:hypothetical protein